MADDANQGPTASKPKVGRSPAFPFIPLEKALAQARALYGKEGKYAAPMTSAFKAWGYGEKSSGGRQTLAALRYFGLIDITGEGDARQIKISQEALRVLLDEREDGSERRALIKNLALRPSIHLQLHSKYRDGLPSDATVRHFLVFDQKYNEGAAQELLEEYKATAAFAGLFEPSNELDNPGKIPDNDDIQEEADSSEKHTESRRKIEEKTPPPPPLREHRSMQMESNERELTTGLLAKGASFRLIVKGQIGVKEIETLIKKLEIDKEILADNTDEEDS